MLASQPSSSSRERCCSRLPRRRVNVTLSLSFGGIYYDIPSENFAYAEADTEGKSCYGSVYDASGGTSTTLFIIGQAFLKGVYSAYQFDPVSGRDRFRVQTRSMSGLTALTSSWR